jgi:hypothetical protein
MTKRPRKQQYASEHGDAGINGLQDTGSTPVASTISKQPQAFEIERLRFLFTQNRSTNSSTLWRLSETMYCGKLPCTAGIKKTLPAVGGKGLQGNSIPYQGTGPFS